MIRARLTTIAVVAMAVAFGQSAVAAPPEDLGKVHFETSCKPDAQQHFDQAMLYQHSFWYRASQKSFEDALKADPECAIAYWGIALSLLYNPHVAPPVKNLAEGAAALEKGKALSAKTPRERDYIDALGAIYADYDKVDHRTRVLNYLKAMEQLAARYSDDDEAQIYYALALNVGAPPADKTYANQLKGAAILEKIWTRQPDHPGVAHYLIHLYDTPALAEKGLEAARRYAKVAPGAAHAQHMPSHIFTRVGYWKDSIAANAASVQAAKASKEIGDQLHGQDYLVYAYLQLGQDKEALGVVEEIAAARPDPDAFAAAFSQAAAPARYMVERGDWNGAANLEVKPSKFPHAMAISHFARAIGAARSGKTEAAKVDTAKLAEMRDRLREAKNSYWAGQVDVQQQIATAWVLYADGKQDEALKVMRAAVDAEDNTEKAPVTPGPLAPTRELYGFMLLDRGMAKEALAVFEATMPKEPNRFNGYLGAAKAAQGSGDTAKAKATYGKLVTLAAESEPQRPTLAAA